MFHANPNYRLLIYANVNLNLALRAAASNRYRTVRDETFATKLASYTFIIRTTYYEKKKEVTNYRCKFKTSFVTFPFGQLVGATENYKVTGSAVFVTNQIFSRAPYIRQNYRYNLHFPWTNLRTTLPGGQSIFPTKI